MRRPVLVAIGAVVLSMLQTQRVLCADLAGSVVDTQGHPVAGAKILIKNLTNRVLSEVHSNGSGRYQVTGITPGSYQYILFPVSGFKGGDAVSYLSDKGLAIDWHVSDTAPAIAFASIGGGSSKAGTLAADDPYGFSNEEYTAILVGSVALVGGGVVGGLAAAGEFSGSSSNPPASPSL
jgi:Carboxypeptidase regulatory-like domain